MKILVAHNFYKQTGGEDPCVAAEIASLEANGHDVTSYYAHNDNIDGMSRLRVASRTVWSSSSYREIRKLIKRHRPQIAHFHNTFPLISPAAYYAGPGRKMWASCRLCTIFPPSLSQRDFLSQWARLRGLPGQILCLA